MFRWLLSVSAALALNVSVASAGPPAPVPPTWSGFYIGGHVGYGWGDVDATLTSITGDYDVKGGLIGLQAGRNWQSGSIVYGWIADASITGIDGRWVFDSPRYLNTEYDWLATLRGRVGHVFGNMFAYITGGLAMAGIESIRSDPAARSHESRVGYAIGVGLEWRGPAGWTYQIEYLHRDFGTQSLTNYRLDHTLDTVTVGMNRRY
jgi:outer membrane immunogenic protein